MATPHPMVFFDNHEQQNIHRVYAELPRQPNSAAHHICDVSVTDPDTNAPVELAIYKDDLSHGMFGIDSSYLLTLSDNDPVVEPFRGSPVYLIEYASTPIMQNGKETQVFTVKFDDVFSAVLPNYLSAWKKSFSTSLEAVEYVKKRVECVKLWCSLGDAPFASEKNDEVLDVDWHIFKQGDTRSDIWHWFEETYNCSVGAELMMVPINAYF